MWGFFLDFLRGHIDNELMLGSCLSTNIRPKLCAALGCAVLHGNLHFNALALHEGFRHGGVVWCKLPESSVGHG